MKLSVARTMVAALIMLESVPRFGPRNRRIAIDSYSVAADIRAQLVHHGWKPDDPKLQPEGN